MKMSKLFALVLFAATTLFTACNKDESRFISDYELENTVTTSTGEEILLETREDTMEWIREESKNREVHTDYLLEFPPAHAHISGKETLVIGQTYDGERLEKEALIVDGQLIVEGDMVYGTEAEYRSNLSKARGRAAVNKYNNNKWNYGIMPYVIEAGHPNRSRIEEGIQEANGTFLTLVPRTTEEDYVIFRKSDRNNSYIGRIGNAQTINISNGASKGTVIHEILHAAGLYHEHTRCDRDNYVNIKWHNLNPYYNFDFEKQCDHATTIYGYDFGSIMHYGPTGGSKNGYNVIEPATGNPFKWLDQYFTMGQRKAMSGTDWWSVAYLYPLAGGHNVRINTKHSNKFLQANGYNQTVTQQWNGEESPFNILQTFYPVKATDDYFYLRHISTGMYMGVKNKSKNNLAPVELQAFDGGEHQQFKIETAQSGTHYIQIRHSGKYFDIEGASGTRGARLIQHDFHGNNNQQFSFRY